MAEVEAMLKQHQVNRAQANNANGNNETPNISMIEVDHFSPTEISRLYDNTGVTSLYENSVSKPVDSIQSSIRLPAANSTRTKGAHSQMQRAPPAGTGALRDFDPIAQKSMP